MTSRGRSSAVTRHLRAPLVWPLLVLAIVAPLLVFSDVPASRPHRFDPEEESRVAGEVVFVDRVRHVRYRHPITRQVVDAPLYTNDVDVVAEEGETVHVLAQRDDPLSVAIEGDRVPLSENLVSHAIILAAAAIPFAARRLSTRRIERVAAGDAPSFAMTGALFASARLNRCHLLLYPLDAGVGAPPMCSVSMLTTAQAPLVARTFPVEVKGSPRPFGRVVAHASTGVLWPAGRAHGRTRRHDRPALTGGPPTRLEPADGAAGPWRPRWVPFFTYSAAAMGAATALLAFATTVTLTAAVDVNRVSRDGRQVVGEIVRFDGEDDVLVLRYKLDGTHETRAGVDYASDYERGMRYPIRLDPRNPRRARLETEPYDVIEPLAYAALPLAGAALWFGRRVGVWRSLRRSARRGPWWAADAVTLANDGRIVTVGLFAGDDLVGAVPVATPALSARRGRNRVMLGGDLEPGSPVALWWRDDAASLDPMGLTTVPDALPAHLVMPRAGDAPSPDATPTSQPLESSSPLSYEIPVKHYRIALRKPRLEVFAGTLSMTLPSYFGRRRWDIPVKDIAVVDLLDPAYAEDAERDLPEIEGVSVPYIVTTGPYTTPTLMLLFARPQRVPPLRLATALAPNIEMPWGYRSSRSERGDHADGITLRAVDSVTASEMLARAGATRATKPLTWLATRRPELVDPVANAPVARKLRWARRLRWVGFSLYLGAAPMAFFADRLAGWVFVLLGGLVGLGFVLLFLASRVQRRALSFRGENAPEARA